MIITMHNFECPSCKNAIDPGQKFCDKCGKEVDETIQVCEKCHTHLSPHAKFCTHCGHSLPRKIKFSFVRWLQIIFVCILLFLIIAMMTRQNIYDDSISDSIEKTITEQPEIETVLKEPQLDINTESIEQQKKLYQEMSFNTLVFNAEVTHEVEIAVKGPTNKAFMEEAVRQLLIDKQIKIQPSDVLEVDVYENINDTQKEHRAHFIYYNSTINTEYSLPKGNYQSLGDGLYAEWNVQEKGWW